MYAEGTQAPERRTAQTLLEKRARFEGMIRAREEVQQDLDIAADRERQLRENYRAQLRQHMELSRELEALRAAAADASGSPRPAP